MAVDGEGYGGLGGVVGLALVGLALVGLGGGIGR